MQTFQYHYLKPFLLSHQLVLIQEILPQEQLIEEPILSQENPTHLALNIMLCLINYKNIKKSLVQIVTNMEEHRMELSHMDEKQNNNPKEGNDHTTKHIVTIINNQTQVNQKILETRQQIKNTSKKVKQAPQELIKQINHTNNQMRDPQKVKAQMTTITSQQLKQFHQLKSWQELAAWHKKHTWWYGDIQIRELIKLYHMEAKTKQDTLDPTKKWMLILD